MTKLIHQPADKLFKQAMADKHIAREFFTSHLPAEILEKIDLNSLALQKHSFIDQAYKATEADVVYAVNIGDALGYLYILCEHQHKIDDTMAFRLLRYIVRMMELHTKQHPQSPLPLVYPLVLYTGEKPWDAPRDIFKLFGEQETLARQILLQPFQLIDLHRIQDEELRKSRLSGLAEFVLKYRTIRDFEQYLETFLPWVRKVEVHESGNFARFVLGYVIDSIEADNERLFIEKSHQYLSEKLLGDVMTLAQRFEQKGIEKGIQQGMQQGEYRLLLRQLRRKFHDVPEAYVLQLTNADAQTLLTLGDRILEAKTLQDIFGEE